MTMMVKRTWKGEQVKKDERKGAARGLYLAAEEILARATDIVPLREGTLERSGVAHHPGRDGLGPLEAAVTYDTPYAVRQHEELTYQHPRGRQAKYLETPLNASQDMVKKLVAREIKSSLGG